jgi:hypothetical protein
LDSPSANLAVPEEFVKPQNRSETHELALSRVEC